MRAVPTFWLGLLCSAVCSTCFGQAPANDNFTNASVLYGNSTTFSGSLTNATFEAGEGTTSCNFDTSGVGASLWWSWAATNSTPVVIDVLGSELSYAFNGLAVLSGANLQSLTYLDCSILDVRTNRYILFAANAGTTYHIRVWGPAASFTLRLTATNAPVILSPPQSQTVAESASVMFGVIAGGLRPLKYQWQFVGNEMAGQTAPTLVLHHLSTSRAGGYSVVVSNLSGVTTSAVATLSISPTRTPLVLAAVNSPDTNHFSFSLAGEIGRSYRVSSTTDMINWVDEETVATNIFFPGVVRNASATSVYSIPIVTGQKLLRASHYVDTEMCIAQLQAINHALRLWAIESSADPTSPVTEKDITPYLMGDFSCPSGGTTFADSYYVFDIADRPVCQRVPALHVLRE